MPDLCALILRSRRRSAVGHESGLCAHSLEKMRADAAPMKPKNDADVGQMESIAVDMAIFCASLGNLGIFRNHRQGPKSVILTGTNYARNIKGAGV